MADFTNQQTISTIPSTPVVDLTGKFTSESIAQIQQTAHGRVAGLVDIDKKLRETAGFAFEVSAIMRFLRFGTEEASALSGWMIEKRKQNQKVLNVLDTVEPTNNTSLQIKPENVIEPKKVA